MLSWCLWLVAPFFSKGISDPEICITKQVPPFLHTLFSYNLGCPLLQYPSEQETRTSEFSKCGTNLMCNCTQVLVNCFLVFFCVNIHVYRAVWDFQMKGTTMSSYSLCCLLLQLQISVAIKQILETRFPNVVSIDLTLRFLLCKSHTLQTYESLKALFVTTYLQCHIANMTMQWCLQLKYRN